ncbi:MAG: hypothetical protein WB615_02645 [Candidatus Tumulicola sp.]
MLKVFFTRLIVGALAAAAACSGPSQSPSASGVPSLTNPPSVLNRLAHAPAAPAGKSWMSPGAKSAALLYVSNFGSGTVNVYSYPAMKQLGVLVGFEEPEGICVDAAQDAYLVDFGAAQIVEYGHGSIAPLRVLNDHQGAPFNCAVDPDTGDLAVANVNEPPSMDGNVIVYRGAKGTPTKYTAPGFTNCYFVGYDPAGNLFVDGVNGSSVTVLAELAKGKSAFKSIVMNEAISMPGGVAWDGTLLAVGDQLANTIYQFKVSGNKATEQGSTALNGAVQVSQFWFTGSTSKHPQATAVLGADFGQNEADQWQYPAGGTPVKTITGLDEPEGIALSK